MKNRIGINNPMYGRKHSKESIVKIKISSIGNKNRLNSSWSKTQRLKFIKSRTKKIGTLRMHKGYLIIKLKNKWESLHRYLVEKYIKRELTNKEIVHHIDGNKLNNKLSNLYIFKNRNAHHCIEILIRERYIDRYVLKSNLNIWR